MNEVTKITFYGKDFSPLTEATYRLDGKEEKIKVNESEKYLKLLKKFCVFYNKEKGIRLLFSQDTELDKTYFYGCVGVFRSKEFPFRFNEESSEEIYDVTLEIRCRLDSDEKAYFLGAMLLCGEHKDLDLNVNISFHQVMDIFLLFMYKKQLTEAAKKGIFRKYQRFENNDSRPHGTIDIARHIRENMGLQSGNIAYHYRELTANNPVNRLILAAYKRLCEKFPEICDEHIKSDESVYPTLKMLQTELGYSKTNVRNIVKENLRPVTHPYFSEYEDLRKTCLMILRDENISIFDTEDGSEETQSLYMNVTELWEKFLKFHLDKHLEKPSYSGLSLDDQVTKQTFAERKDKDSRPDFVLWQEEKEEEKENRTAAAIAILDAKFKLRWNKFFNGASGDDSINADINKCIRDMVVFHARRTGVIFPVKEEDFDGVRYYKEYHIGVKDGPVFDMVRVPVPHVPKKEEKMSFDEWYKKLEPLVNQALEEYLEALKKTAAAQPAQQQPLL